MTSLDPSTLARALVDVVSADPTQTDAAADAASQLLQKNGITNPAAFMRSVKTALERHQGIVFGTLTSAHPVTPERMASLTKVIEQLWKKHVTLSSEVDPTLLGGGTLHIGDEHFDGSVKGEIDALVRLLLTPLHH